jgi:hypothetical protein
MHVVYLYRQVGNAEELRFSLRSLRNLPVEAVTVVGDRPRWLHKVNHIPMPQHNETKWLNSNASMQAAISSPDVPDDFVLFHDDFFVLKQLDAIPVLHRGDALRLIEQKWARDDGRYKAGFAATVDALQSLGIAEPLCYELHIPRNVNKQKWQEANDLAKELRTASTTQALHNRTFYGNYWKIGGIQTHDFKLYNDSLWKKDWPFVSTDDRHFTGGSSRACRALKREFREQSVYERRGI